MVTAPFDPQLPPGITAAIFDIGNVLLKFDFRSALRKMGAANVDQLQTNAEWLDLKLRYESGAMDRENFVQTAIKLSGFSGTAEDFQKLWQNIFSLNLPMWKVVHEWRKKIPLYLLSNTNDLHVEHFTREFEDFGIFSGAIYSHEAGMMKPSPEIFELAIRTFGVSPESTVYIDDLIENVEAACAAGLRGMLYTI